MDNQDIEKVYYWKTQKRLKCKRCKWCKFLIYVKEITYVCGPPIRIYRCAYTDKRLSTENLFWDIAGCFCKLYEPKEVVIEIKEK